MVKRRRLVSQQRCEPRFAELAHMCADREAVLFSSRENMSGFFGAECSALTEHVHELRQFSFRYRRNHFVTDQVHVRLGPSAILWWDNVRAEKSRNHRPRPILRCSADNFQGLYFRYQIKAVARLGLDGRGSVTAQISEHRTNSFR